jgi:Ca2+-binding EF-hand superfamily protein
MFERADADGDGAISAEEFRAMRENRAGRHGHGHGHGQGKQMMDE